MGLLGFTVNTYCVLGTGRLALNKTDQVMGIWGGARDRGIYSEARTARRNGLHLEQ